MNILALAVTRAWQCWICKTWTSAPKCACSANCPAGPDGQ